MELGYGDESEPADTSAFADAGVAPSQETGVETPAAQAQASTVSDHGPEDTYRSDWAAGAARRQTPHFTMEVVDPHRERVVSMVRRVSILAAVAVGLVLVVAFGAPPLVRWAERTMTQDTTTTTVATDPCQRAFSAAIEEATEAAQLGTLVPCSEQQWSGQQAATPLPGVTLRALCDRRNGLATAACASSDAALQAEQAAVVEAQANALAESVAQAEAARREQTGSSPSQGTAGSSPSGVSSSDSGGAGAPSGQSPQNGATSGVPRTGGGGSIGSGSIPGSFSTQPGAGAPGPSF